MRIAPKVKAPPPAVEQAVPAKAVAVAKSGVPEGTVQDKVDEIETRALPPPLKQERDQPELRELMAGVMPIPPVLPLKWWTEYSEHHRTWYFFQRDANNKTVRGASTWEHPGQGIVLCKQPPPHMAKCRTPVEQGHGPKPLIKSPPPKAVPVDRLSLGWTMAGDREGKPIWYNEKYGIISTVRPVAGTYLPKRIWMHACTSVGRALDMMEDGIIPNYNTHDVDGIRLTGPHKKGGHRFEESGFMLTSDGQTRAPVIVPRGTPERQIPSTIGNVTQCSGSYLVIGTEMFALT